MCTVCLNSAPARSAVSCINGEKSWCPRGNPARQGACWLLTTDFPRSLHCTETSALPFLHSKPNLLFAIEAHGSTRLPLTVWSWMQDALHSQTTLTSVMLIACLCCRPLLPIISDGLLA